MKIEKDRIIDSILESLSEMSYVKSGEIPNIDLYMDQVTSFMNSHLEDAKRFEDDKILTKTMINNYAKNHLLPAPEKKKYSKEHILVLLFIYYFKNILSIGDIQSVLNPLTECYFNNGRELNLQRVYEEVFSLEENQMKRLKENLVQDYKKAEKTFEKETEEDRAFLQMFSFICMLSYDIYIRKQIIEKLIDDVLETPEKK